VESAEPERAGNPSVGDLLRQVTHEAHCVDWHLFGAARRLVQTAGGDPGLLCAAEAQLRSRDRRWPAGTEARARAALAVAIADVTDVGDPRPSSGDRVHGESDGAAVAYAADGGAVRAPD
jgi:hypothetical protein